MKDPFKGEPLYWKIFIVAAVIWMAGMIWTCFFIPIFTNAPL